MDTIGPSGWLDEHQPVGDFGALDAGRIALASHNSNVWVAIHSEPELRLGTALAWLSEVGRRGDASDARTAAAHSLMQVMKRVGGLNF